MCRAHYTQSVCALWFVLSTRSLYVVQWLWRVYFSFGQNAAFHATTHHVIRMRACVRCTCEFECDFANTKTPYDRIEQHRTGMERQGKVEKNEKRKM